LVLLLGPVLLSSARLYGAEAEAVVIALRPSVKAGQRVISMSDIADVYGGDSAVSQRIARLDVLDNRGPGTPETISKRQIRIRLILAGIPGESFSLLGAEHVEITPQLDTIDDQLVTESIRAALVHRFQVQESDLNVRLAQPLPVMPDLTDVAADDIKIEPYLPDTLPRGRTKIRLAIHVGGRLRRNLSVTVDVTEYREIAVATQAVPRGQVLSDSDLKSERRPIAGTVQYASVPAAVGRKSKRAFRPGEAIRAYDIEEPRDESPLLVKYGDTVRLVAKKGRLAVTLAAAQSLQQGRLGDVIRVRNIDSRRVIVGKVVGPGELEVRF